MPHLYYLSMIISHKPGLQLRKLATSKNPNCTLCSTKVVVCGDLFLRECAEYCLPN